MSKNKMIRKNIALYILPVLIWMAIIFHFSSQSFNQQNLIPWLQKNVSETAAREHLSGIDFNYGGSEISIAKLGVPDFLQFFIRKGAHMIEFGLLGMLICWMFHRIYRSGLWIKLGLSWLVCVIYAALDEFHQIFSNGRTPSIVDVLLDSASALIGITLILLTSRNKNTYRI